MKYVACKGCKYLYEDRLCTRENGCDRLFEMPPKLPRGLSNEMVILRYLEQGNSITVKDATVLFGICTLRETIRDLRESGYNIQDEWVDGFNRRGNKVRFKRYFLVKEG